MSRKMYPKALTFAGALVSAALSVFASAALAQDAPPPGYDPNANPNYQDNGPPPGYAPNAGPGYGYNAPPPEPIAPPGYNGTQMPPPPPGYAAGPDMAAQQGEDEQYAAAAQQWMAQNCVKSHNNAAAGAVVGGILGAIVGGGMAGWHNRGAGMVVGGAVGAGAGAMVGASSGNETSPGCPPGYVVRQGAYGFGYAPPGYYYAAPAWYQPWVFVGGAWVYRPYPYHSWYWHTYRGPRGWHEGWHGRRHW